MMYNPQYVRQFYNEYGSAEWSRLERSVHGRLQSMVHEDFIRRYINRGQKVLDAGSGPGRFSIFMSKIGAKITVLDVSETQLELARRNIMTAGLIKNTEKFIRADICDFSMMPDNSFDITVSFGGPLSYVCERRFTAVDELVRVTKPEGVILVSVMSLMGVLIGPAVTGNIAALASPDKTVSGNPPLWPVAVTGDLPAFPSHSAGINHAPMHLYTADELGKLFGACTVLETAGSNVTLREHDRSCEKIAENPNAWDTLVKLEKKLNHDPGLVNSGSHIIMAVRKK